MCSRLLTGSAANAAGRESGARTNDVSDREADHQREARHDFEIENGLYAHAADFLHLGDAVHAEHHGQENDRSDQHLDQRDEGVPERFEGHPDGGREVPDQPTDDDGQKHIKIKSRLTGPQECLPVRFRCGYSCRGRDRFL